MNTNLKYKVRVGVLFCLLIAVGYSTFQYYRGFTPWGAPREDVVVDAVKAALLEQVPSSMSGTYLPTKAVDVGSIEILQISGPEEVLGGKLWLVTAQAGGMLEGGELYSNYRARKFFTGKGEFYVGRDAQGRWVAQTKDL